MPLHEILAQIRELARVALSDPADSAAHFEALRQIGILAGTENGTQDDPPPSPPGGPPSGQ